MSDNWLDSETRRAVLKATAGALGVAAGSGLVGGHPGAGDHGDEDHEHPGTDAAGTTWVGYDGLGGEEADYHYGGISEMKVQDGLAFVGILSSKDPTIDRGMAIIDVSDYTEADGKEDLEDAEMEVLSFLPNENNFVSVMDVKLSADTEYAFISKQPIAVLFEDEEPRTNPENLGNSPEAASLQAVDVSDPENPEIVGRWDGWGLGPHNSDHLRIDDTDYVFAVKGPTGEPAGIYVIQFDRSSGAMVPVNYWTEDTNAATGEFGDPTDDTAANGNEMYMHDITVVEDPQTGTPLAYAANWNNGGLVLDVTDPTDIRELGQFEMQRCHEIEPATVTDPAGEPTRVFVAAQENPDSEYGQSDDNPDYENDDHETGYAYVVDCDDIFADDFEQGAEGNLGTASNLDPDADRNELGKWILSLNTEFDNYTLSAHNLDIFEAEVDNQIRQFVALGHYHAGTRILEFTEALGGPGTTYLDCGIREGQELMLPYNGDDGFGEVAYFRTHEKDVPAEAKMAGLTEATPDFWCAIEDNGVIFASGINTGLYAFTVDPDRGKDASGADSFCSAPAAPDIPVGGPREPGEGGGNGKGDENRGGNGDGGENGQGDEHGGGNGGGNGDGGGSGEGNGNGGGNGNGDGGGSGQQGDADGARTSGSTGSSQSPLEVLVTRLRSLL